MERSRPLPWLVLALATGLVGWFLGRASAPDREGPLSALDARLSAPARSGPMLEGAPSRAGSRSTDAPTQPATRPEGAGPAEAPPSPDGGAAASGASVRADGDAPNLVLPLEGLDWGPFGQKCQPAEADPALGETTRLMASDPEAAAARLASLLDSVRPEDRQRAYRALAQARHPLHRRLAQRALDDAKPDDDVQGLMRALARFKGRDWSAEQLTGAPDTPIAGDLPTAWASKEPDMGEVWLELDFPDAVRPERLRVHETFHPGAVARVLVRSGEPDSDEAVIWIEVWRGTAPTPEAPAWFEIPLEASGATRTIRLIVDTSRVEGWNEIDAVELLGDGRRQWAVSARAGSSYAD